MSEADRDIEVCPTCGAACPVRTDTREYVDLIAQGRYAEAFEVIRKANPFPSVCGYICHHPCEEACRRADVDEPVALRNLKRFAVEQARDYRRAQRRRHPVRREQTIGVIGSGPAGLTAAYDCRRAGYAVAVYEALPRAGGLLACGVPKYRLPDDVLAEDLDDILAAGVEVHTGVRVGRDVALADLRERHDALLLALGLSESRTIPFEGADHPQVWGALEFLRAVALNDPPAVGRDVLVIGAGNVAVDAARTAVRLGADTATMVCLENEAEMPAWDWECREALEEGIAMVHRQGPTAVQTDGERITGLEVRAVARVFDDQGDFAPAYHDEERRVLPGDMIIVAVGQTADLGWLREAGIVLTASSRLPVDAETLAVTPGESDADRAQPALRGLFACGEVATGPGAAIEAVASGHRAAQAVMSYLETGRVRPVPEEAAAEEVGELPAEVADKVRRTDRVAMPQRDARERRTSFAPVDLGYDEAMALHEARRCLACAAGAIVDEDKCEACLTCLRVCPFGVPVVDDVAVMCSEQCQACGLCAVECPAMAIRIQRFAVGDIRQRVERLLADARAPVARVEFPCTEDLFTSDALFDRLEHRDGDLVAVVPVRCVARLEEVDLMKPFELGAGAVRVQPCRECRFPAAVGRLAKRMDHTRAILRAAGVDGDRLELAEQETAA